MVKLLYALNKGLWDRIGSIFKDHDDGSPWIIDNVCNHYDGPFLLTAQCVGEDGDFEHSSCVEMLFEELWCAWTR